MPWIEREGRTVEEARSTAVAALGLPDSDIEVEVVREGARGLFGFGGEPALVRVRPRSEARDVRSAFHDRPPGDPPASGASGDGEPAADVAGRIEAVAPEADSGPHPAEAPEEISQDEGALGEVSAGPTERQQQATEVGAEMVNGILERMGLKGEVRTRVAGGTVYIEVFGDDMGILIGRGGKTLEALQDLVRAGVQRRVKARTAVVVDVESYWERRRSEGRSRRREGSSQRP